MTDRTAIYAAINRERDYQDRKRPRARPLSLPGYLIVLRAELEEAERAWVKDSGRNDVPAALEELLQVAAVAVAAIEAHGLIERGQE